MKPDLEAAYYKEVARFLDIEKQLEEANEALLSIGIFPTKKGGLEIRPAAATKYLKKYKLI